MLVAIESDENTTNEFIELVANAFRDRCFESSSETPDEEPLSVFNFSPDFTDDDNFLPVSYLEANRYQNQNNIRLKNGVVLNYYLVNKEYWPRFDNPDYVFVVGPTPFTSRRFKEIRKVANCFNKTRVSYINSNREGITSTKELLRILSMDMFITTIDDKHVFREDLVASDNV